MLRLQRENQLLSPARQPEPGRTNPHEGTIITEVPNQMWGTDATATCTQSEGAVTVFAAIDHCTAECVGIHAVKKATRFEALEPIRQGVREHFGSFSGGSAAGLRLRHDHGSVYMSEDFQNEIKFIGIRILSSIRPAARRKWLHRALLSNLERTVALGQIFSQSRGAPKRAHRLPRALQPPLDSDTPELSYTVSSKKRLSY
jgi:putative transposase